MQTQPEPLTYPFEPGPGLELNPLYAELRNRPLVRVRMTYGDEAWLATTYADVKKVMADPRFSLAAAVSQDQPRLRESARVDGGLLAHEPPEHTRLRGMLGKELSPRRIEQLRGRAWDIAEVLLDRIVRSGPTADLVEQFAVPFPTTLTCERLGVPAEDHLRFWHWADAKLVGAATDEELKVQGEEFFSCLTGLFELRRREPGDDLISRLLQAREADSRITEEEVLTLAGELLTAGFVTVTHQIVNSFYYLLTRSEDLERLRDQPALIPRAVEELTRYVHLNSVLLPRYAQEDVELGGVLVRAGEAVLVALSAANRDPAIFPDAEDLLLDRAGIPHIGFGHGAHYCVGAHLARLELQVALEAVLRRLPGLRLAVPVNELRWKTGNMVNGLHELPVAFDS
ncbi:cytochrome P450 [Streptomyces sp. NPDC002676]